MEKEIELKFIEQTLQQYGARLKSSLIREITDKDLISKGGQGTAHLKNSISYDIARTGINGYELRLFFPDYGRFIEIRYFTGPKRNSEIAFGTKKGKSAKSSNTLLANRNLNRQHFKRKKDTRWYSKTTYGSLNSLIGQLMYGLTDTVQETLKEQLNQPL